MKLSQWISSKKFRYNKENKVSIVYFKNSLQYRHVVNKGYQGEAGLLFRTITVAGGKGVKPSDPDPLNCTQNRWMWGGSLQKSRVDKALTGYSGHIIIHKSGKGYVEEVELWRMGQTNTLGRYPMHFHIIGNECSNCYIRNSSVHRSFYHCVSIHGTHNITVTKHVGYDVIDYCYCLEDGV